MKIHDDHLYHGAALTQIAEHPQFTAINALKVAGKLIHVAYRINDDIAVYFKYATKPTPRFQEYIFTFAADHINELSQIAQTTPKTFVTLICVKDREICCLPYLELLKLIAAREKALGGPEDTHTILVTAPKGKSLRVYVNEPGKKKTILGKEVVVSRSAFPAAIFG
jgi:hypothetical protein